MGAVADYCSNETNKWMNLIDEDCYFLISSPSVFLSLCLEIMYEIICLSCEEEYIYSKQ